MTIREALPREREDDVIAELRDMGEAFGYDAPGPWLLVRKAFHGGGIISQHRSPRAAARKAVREQREHSISVCICGACGVLPVAQIDDLPIAGAALSPCDLARAARQ